MYARSVTVPSVGRADTATPCVLRRRCRASVARRRFAERPRDGSPWPSAESGLEPVNRCVVFPAAASDSASIHETLRDANWRLWPAGPAPALSSTEAQPSQAQPEQAVRWAKASIRTSEYAQLVAQGKMLEQEVSTRGQGRPECSDRPEGVTHRL